MIKLIQDALPWRPTTFALPLLLATITCGPLDVISVEETSLSTIEEASIFEQLLGDMGFGSFINVDIADNQELQNQGVERHQIDSVHATSLTLTILEPTSDQDFSFIESLNFYVSADGLDKVRIASGANFAQGARQIELDLDDIDLAPYATAASMTITSDVEGRRPEHETLIEAKIILMVDLNLGGILCGPGTDESS